MRSRVFLIFGLLASVFLGSCGGASAPPPPPVSVTVTPNPISVAIFTTQQFTATVNGQSSTAVTWEVNGVTGGSQPTGFISTSGLLGAPSGVPTTSSRHRTGTTAPRTLGA